MKRHVALVLICASLAACAAPSPKVERSLPEPDFLCRFDKAFRIEGLPPGFVIAETKSRGLAAAWGPAVGFRGQGTAFGVLESRNFGVTANIAFLEGLRMDRGAARIHLRCLGGRSHQGAGICFAYRDQENYDAAYWSASDQELLVLRIEEGEPRVLASCSAPGNTDTWHRLALRFNGERALVDFDDRSQLVAKLGRVVPGTIALVTHADASSIFDDLALWLSD